MVHYEWVENQLPKFRTQNDRRRLGYKIKMIALVVMTLSLGTINISFCSNKHFSQFGSLIVTAEHILNIISIVHFANSCPHPQKDPIRDFFLVNLSQLFKFTSYAPWKAFLGKILNVICTFIWSYMDLFVMLISVGLSNRFKLVNEDLMRIKGQVCY